MAAASLHMTSPMTSRSDAAVKTTETPTGLFDYRSDYRSDDTRKVFFFSVVSLWMQSSDLKLKVKLGKITYYNMLLLMNTTIFFVP